MRKLILKTLRESIKAYPDIIDLLKGDARLCADIYSYKVGEAPDDDVRRKDERKIERVLIEFFDEQFTRIIKEIKREFGKSVFQPSFWDDEEKNFWDKISGVFISIMLHGLDGASGILSGEAPDTIDEYELQSRVIEEASRYRNKWVKGINETTMKLIWEEIEVWRQTGDPITSLIDMLENKKEFLFGDKRARRIAITETTRLNAIGNQLYFEETGYIREFNWMTAEDELVCPICRKGHEDSPHPIRQMSNLLPAHPNCRCWGQPIVDTDMLNERTRDRWQGINFD